MFVQRVTEGNNTCCKSDFTSVEKRSVAEFFTFTRNVLTNLSALANFTTFSTLFYNYEVDLVNVLISCSALRPQSKAGAE